MKNLGYGHKLIAALTLSGVFGVALCQSNSKLTHPTMSAAISIFDGLTDHGMLPLTQPTLEAITGASLLAPNRNYPPGVSAILKKQGILLPDKPGYIEATTPINEDLDLKIHFASPVVSLFFVRSGKSRVSLPPALTQESLTQYTKSIASDFEAALLKNCIAKKDIFQLLTDNGWVHTRQPMTAEMADIDGNFLFIRLNYYVMATLDKGCLQQLTIDSPRALSATSP